MDIVHTILVYLGFIIWIILTNVADSYKMCYSCTRIPYPRDCNHVTKCSEDESCMTHQYVSDSGHVWYDTGCIPNQRCSLRRRQSKRMLLNDVNGDVTACLECCHGELCNSHGCSSQALPDRNTRGPVCFSCNQQRFADSCDIVAICKPSETCYLQFNYANITNDPIYSSGCMRTSQCPRQTRLLGPRGPSSACTGCCVNDYCNRNCSALGTGGLSTISSTIKTTKTTTISTTTTTTTARTSTSTVPSTSMNAISTTLNHMNAIPFEQRFCESAQYIYNASLGICYKIFSNVSLPWQQSRYRCRHDGGDLIIFHSVKEELVFETLSKDIFRNNLKEIRFWVGASDILTEMVFLWVDGSQVYYNFFHPGEPNNAFDGEDCLAATFFDDNKRRVLLNDDKCSLPSHFICELDIKSLHNTHTNRSSSPGPCMNHDYTYASQINMCYKVHTNRHAMTEARLSCQKEEADLLVLPNLQSELYFQQLSFHDKNNDNRYWIGGQRTPEDKFTWFDGFPLSSSLRWFEGEPNNYEQNESCISMTYFSGDREDFFLNDDNCAKQLFYICEEKCPDSTYKYIPSLNLCYKIYNESVTWSGAINRCQQDRASLAEVDNVAILSYFQITLGDEARGNGHKYWVGANYSNGQFHWLSTNHMISQELWQVNEPLTKGENCVALHWFPAPYGNTLKLNNRPCDIHDRFICQYIPGFSGH